MLNPKEVQDKLNSIGYMREFTVTFIKKDGTERTITGWTEAPVAGSPHVTSAVAMREKNTGEWKAFRIDSVIGLTA